MTIAITGMQLPRYRRDPRSRRVDGDGCSASGFRAKLPRLEALQIKGLDHAGGDRRELGRGEPAERALQLIGVDRGGWRHPAMSGDD